MVYDKLLIIDRCTVIKFSKIVFNNGLNLYNESGGFMGFVASIETFKFDNINEGDDTKRVYFSVNTREIVG